MSRIKPEYYPEETLIVRTDKGRFSYKLKWTNEKELITVAKTWSTFDRAYKAAVRAIKAKKKETINFIE